MNPKVSVVLVCYNRGKFLPKTLDSILGQTYKDFELIVSDDCSTDDTPNIVKAYSNRDTRIRYRCNSKNLGMPRNLIAGISETCGGYIAILHDGDLYSPELLEEWKNALDQHPSAAFVFNAYRCLDREGNTKRIFEENLPKCFSGHRLLEQIYFKRWNFSSPVWGTVMVRRQAYEAVGRLDHRFGFYADVDMWMKMAEHFDVCYVAEPFISLPSRKRMPRLFKIQLKKQLKINEKIFFEARLRHWRSKPLKCLLEIVRHYSFLVSNRWWITALAVRRTLRENANRLFEIVRSASF